MVAFAALVAIDLTLGLCVFIVVAFAERLPAAGASDLTLVKVLGALLAVSWLATVATRHRAGERQLFTAHPVMSAAGALLLAWMILSVGWAEDPDVAREYVMRYALNFALLPIVYTAVQRREHVVAVMSVYVGSAVAAALYGMFTVGDDYESLGRISGLVGTANELASVLVTAMFLAGGLLIALKGSPLLRTLCFAAIAICLIGLFLTQSRAGLIALGTALFAAVVVGGRRRFVVAVLVALVSITTVGYFAFVATDEVRAPRDDVRHRHGPDGHLDGRGADGAGPAGHRRRRRQLPDGLDPLPAAAGGDPARRVHRRPAADHPQLVPQRAGRDRRGGAGAVLRDPGGRVHRLLARRRRVPKARRPVPGGVLARACRSR